MLGAKCYIQSVKAHRPQSLAVTDKSLFRNCLVIMRPKMIIPDLPSTHTVADYIHNQFVTQLKKLNTEIAVSNEKSALKLQLTELAGCTWKDCNDE